MADPVDPIIKFTTPGGGTFDLCSPNVDGFCTMTLVNGAGGNTTIGADGFANFAVKNVQDPASFLSVDSIDFTFQTDNLFQPFSAFTNAFTDAFLQRNFGEGCLISGELGCVLPNPQGTLEVKYSGIAKPADPGSASLDAIPCFLSEGCPTAVGFVPFSSIDVTVHYVVSHLDPDCCVGIQPGVEATLSITSDVPEPSTFVLLFGAAGVLAIKRRLRRT
ncbi:MAG: hypothetical protein DMG57_40305 [Acidobacteria bacterium]|nr:MAG: hypothetical protein DMG57_40305 [Acidobacteriota bacterium]